MSFAAPSLARSKDLPVPLNKKIMSEISLALTAFELLSNIESIKISKFALDIFKRLCLDKKTF